MLLKNTFIFKEIGEEGMLIPIVGGNVNASKIFNLNETGTYTIKKLMDDVEIEDIINDIKDHTAEIDMQIYNRISHQL